MGIIVGFSTLHSSGFCFPEGLHADNLCWAGFPWCSSETQLDCWAPLSVQYSLQYQGGSLSKDVSLQSQHPESSAGLPDHAGRGDPELPWAGSQLLSVYSMLRSASQPGAGMFLYPLPSIHCWKMGEDLSPWVSLNWTRVSILRASSAFSVSDVFSCVTTQLCNCSKGQTWSELKLGLSLKGSAYLEVSLVVSVQAVEVGSWSWDEGTLPPPV